MNPTPVRSMQLATCCGVSVISAPSASRKSAEPERELIARLPCFATFAPPAAATKAAAVEALKTFCEPPVPAVSSSGRASISTRSDFSRITFAMPVISSTLSPFRRSAVTKAPNCASLASPSMMSRMQPAASSSVRCLPSSTSAMIASRIMAWLPPQTDEVAGRRNELPAGRIDAEHERFECHGAEHRLQTPPLWCGCGRRCERRLRPVLAPGGSRPR